MLLGPFLNTLTHIYDIEKDLPNTIQEALLSAAFRVDILGITSCQGVFNVFSY